MNEYVREAVMGAWFALGFFPIYKALDLLVDMIPMIYRKRQSDAARRLRKAQGKGKATVTVKTEHGDMVIREADVDVE